MNKFINTLFTTALVISAFNASAATKSENAECKKHDNQSKMDMKMMDTNNDGSVSKDEYMSFHDKAYGSMKQTNGGVSNKDMNSAITSGLYKNSMNNKPIGTTKGKSNNGSTDDTKVDEPVNGTTTGTN